SEREAYHFILEFLQQEHLQFLQAVVTLSAAVRAQADGSMDDYFPKTVLAKKIETFILEEPAEVLISNVRQQAMLCIVALREPRWRCGSPSSDVPRLLACQTIQALDDMLHALVMDGTGPNMLILQNFLEIILPWLTLSDKVHEQTRALGTISRMLRFVCNFPELSHVMEFSMSGKLMGLLGLSCMNPSYELGVGASEALHYLFKILVLHRIPERDADVQRRLLFSPQFFRKFLSPEERTDVLMVSMEALTSASRHDVCAASKMLTMILKSSMPEIGKVPEIIQFIYHNMSSITEDTAQAAIKKILHLLAQTYTDEVILTLFKMEDHSQRGARKPWEILASFPKGYEVIMENLLHRLTPYQKSRGQGASHRTEISPLIATRAIHELLLEPSRRMEVQVLFSSLFMALLLQISFLVLEGAAEIIQDQQHVTEWVDPVSSTVEALKTLMRSAGYGDHVSYVQKLGGWETLTSPEMHYKGVAVLARAMVLKSCWHSRPIFSLTVRILQELDHANHLTALVFVTELLQCPDVAATVDEVTVHILADWFQYEEPATVKLLLRAVEIFAKHRNMVKWGGGPWACSREVSGMGTWGESVPQLRILEPYVLNCCHSADSDIVMETLLVLRCLVENLTWQDSSSFLVQLAFTLAPFFEEVKSQTHLRLAAFEIYRSLLAKVRRKVLVFPLKHQVLNLVVPLVLHMEDVNIDVAQVRGSLWGQCSGQSREGLELAHVLGSFLSFQICRPILRRVATILGWWKLKAIFAKRDTWTILRALLEQKANKALWFLKQCEALFNSPQARIRQAAVWFAGQIIQTLGTEDTNEIEEAYSALRHMQEDGDPMVSCLARQTLYVLEAKEKQLVDTPTSCFCSRRSRKSWF
uniref:Maestro heat like repeat family member 7 n=1 Tax=Equus caballus TaxID=9796 RepID=A0A3Q2LSE0_HORSE